VAKPAESTPGDAVDRSATWRVRRAQPRDAREIAALGAAAFARGWSPASIADELTRSDAETWALAASDRSPLDGFLLARRIPAEGAGAASCDLEVMLVAVRESERRRGGASALLAAALEGARRDGIGRVRLDVRASNAAAIGLYLRHGFAVVGRRPRYYEAREDAILMRLELEPG